jgi:hypothetical protein
MIFSFLCMVGCGSERLVAPLISHQVDATILRTAVVGIVVGDRFILAVADCRHAGGRHAAACDRSHHRLRAGLRQGLVGLRRADIVGVPLHRELQAGIGLHHPDDLIDDGL